MWDLISQVQHEEMVYEISDLLHRRLVSSTLGSEFRTVMELHMQVSKGTGGGGGGGVRGGEGVGGGGHGVPTKICRITCSR